MKKIMKKLALVLISVLMALSLTACGSDEGTGTTDGEVTYKDTFTYAIGGEPNYLDPAVATDSVASYILNQTYYPLFAFVEDGSTVNEACTEYELDDTQTVYTLHLTEDNYWSDGQQVVAGDYVYGMLRSLGLGSADSHYSYFIRNYVKGASQFGADGSTAKIADMEGVVGIEALDDFTIQITLEKPCSYFLSLMTSSVFYPVRSDYAPELDYTWAGELHPTNGAYTYSSIDNKTEIDMVKNEYFPMADQVTTPNLRAVVMADPEAQLMAFQTGEIDFASNVEPSTVVNLYEGQPELLISSAVLNYYMQMNSYRASDALKDVRVRRAIQLGIDRNNIITALDAEGVYYELLGYVPKGMPGVDGDFRQEQDDERPLVYTDKDEARALMEQAGYSETNRLQLTYSTNSAAMHDTVAAVIAEELKDIYIDVSIENKELRVFFDERDQQGITELARGSMSADYMDPTTYLEMANSKNQYGNQTWGDATYDAMLAEADLLTGTERMEKLHEAENYLVEEMAYTCPLFGYSNVALGKAGIEGYSCNPQGSYTFAFIKVPA